MIETYLVIPDLQIPYEANGSLDFCQHLKRHYKIQDENCLCVGDELDSFHGSAYSKGADYDITPKQELKIAKEKMKEWFAVFPKMKLAVSNHGLRWAKRASEAEIPSELLRAYEQIIEAPEGWKWKQRWTIEASKKKFILTHGMEYGGTYAYRQAPTVEGLSVVFGHLHSSAGIAYVKSGHSNLWGFNVGCLIDVDAYAFSYGKYNRFKPNLGVGIIANGGEMPFWIPFDGG